MDADSRVQLTRIEGKLDLVNERHETMKEDVRKIERTHADFSRRVDERFHTHGNRLQMLEARNHVSEGERAAVRASARALWAVAGGSGLLAALLAAIMRHFGI
ncbi:MAG TPA: hypothetical protein VGF77_10555 [Allosphingosinicella sp.]